ncbi:glycine betaine/L-proline ABC transporter ATP-binding protein [Aquamicrobium lusatiense]|uniref:quaternary amine ABC transporter ATP-binding protein n=1 Tax=Aquamicrobium lusatiense TaxID=89772 RepID=UPI0024570C36|nr:glycine betaine/L-proline ABC transporter ATP-binding protein [Aquamicrobium lusatiense]MDH4989598.1 glycine betaine/L-proline ABC transporter ATP-binding protein [Aquamicrobium lusatiense]
MSERLRVEGLYKIFGEAPQKAVAMLESGADKDRVLTELRMVVGLNDVSLSVPSGAIYMIMGLSGSGKSTLARCINRLNEPSAGRILLDGRDLVPLGEAELREVRRTRISMVFQHFALLPNKNVIANVEFGLKLRGVPPAERRRRAEEVLAVVGLARWAYHEPHELSGGMRQRVGLARALATDADVLIMDEAFSALDPLIRSEMQDELLRLQGTLQKTILFITHDFQEALKLGNRIAIMADGKVVREGAPEEIVLDPGSDYVASFTRDVDRARLFDVSMAMTAADHPVELGTLRLVPDGQTGQMIAVDAQMQVLGSVKAGDVDSIRSGAAPEGLVCDDVVCVPSDMKLIDAARLYSSGRPLAVVDGSRRLVGRLAPERMLAAIAPLSSQPGANSTGAPHV